MSTPVSFNLAAAVSQNRFWASNRRQVKRGPKRLVWQGQGWGPIYGAIAAWVFGQYDPPPTREQFAHMVAGWQRSQEGMAVNGVLSQVPWRKLLAQVSRGIPTDYASPVGGLVRPHEWEQIIATFGDPRSMSQQEWETYYIGTARAPGPRRFVHPDGSQTSALRLHRVLAPHAERFFAAVARGGLWDELQPIGRAYEWNPKANDLHTWGIALDIRPSQYPAVARPRDYPDPEHYPPGYLLRHIQAFGWQWGIWFDRPHPGHLQYATGVEGC